MTFLHRRPSFSLASLCHACQIRSSGTPAMERNMTDLLMVALGVGGFVLLGAYAALCARL